VAFHPAQAGADVVANSSNMNIGSTSTETTPSNLPAVMMAVPGIKGSAAAPTDWSAIASSASAAMVPA
jgi:hypothetical protein